MFVQRLSIITALLAMCLVLPMAGQAQAGRGDRLALPKKTVTKPVETSPKAAYDLWVGEVQLRGKKRLWLELYDGHGEVVYDSEVIPNVSHVLPGGRVIVVRKASDGQLVASEKSINDRVAASFDTVTTYKMARGNEGVLTVAYSHPKAHADKLGKPGKAENESELMKISRFGEMVWQAIASFFDATAKTVRYAWASVVGVWRA